MLDPSERCLRKIKNNNLKTNKWYKKKKNSFTQWNGILLCGNILCVVYISRSNIIWSVKTIRIGYLSVYSPITLYVLHLYQHENCRDALAQSGAIWTYFPICRPTLLRHYKYVRLNFYVYERAHYIYIYRERGII